MSKNAKENDDLHSAKNWKLDDSHLIPDYNPEDDSHFQITVKTIFF